MQHENSEVGRSQNDTEQRLVHDFHSRHPHQPARLLVTTAIVICLSKA